jgi:general stress protein YciG
MEKEREIKKKMPKSEAGRLGAMALNADPAKKSAAARKAAITRKLKNPNTFVEIGKKGGKAGKGSKRK